MKKVVVAFTKCLLLLSACASSVSVPGETRNPPNMANFAANQVFSSLKYYTPGCNDGVVLNTVFDGYPHKDNKNAWNEIWAIDMCGKRFDVPLYFYAVNGDLERTTVVIRVKEIKQIH